MSRSIVLYISVSLDGFIAKKTGAVDWLGGNGEIENPDNGFDSFYSTIDTVVMGSTTFDQVINELSPDKWVYEGKKCYVATSKERIADNRAEFISGKITEFIKKIKKEQGKDIWLVGGGKLIDTFIKENLIDKYIITVIPTILGDGIPLFLKENPEIKLKLIETKNVDGMVELSYERRKI